MDKTKEILKKMLTENTGTHFLDSGGTNGRAWQRNQGRDFDKEPESTVKFSVYERDVFQNARRCERCSQSFMSHNRYGEVPCPKCGGPTTPICKEKSQLETIVTHSTYHWLAQRCTYNEELDTRFHDWVAEVDTASSPNYRERSWSQLMQEWLDVLKESREVSGIYGDGEPVTVNTYNGEDCLSQTLQFLYWEDDDGGHILLQIHGGADVRGGYTTPRVFDAHVDEGIFDNARASLYCNREDHTVCGASWYSDNGGHKWYPSNRECDLDNVIEFEGDNMVTCDRNLQPHEKHGHAEPGMDDALCNFPNETSPIHVWEEGKVVVFDKRALCPECGKGELASGFY
jgi:predicted RNA-binding Zn-ribbon protein involved in translation (DUF1610 family)